MSSSSAATAWQRVAELGDFRRATAIALIAAVALAGCGGRSTGLPAITTSKSGPSWSATMCRHQAEVITDDAEQILLHYGAQSAYPADLAYYMFRSALTEFERHGCTPQLLGSTLDRRLTNKQLTELLSHLPSTIMRYLRHAGLA
jgi:hypothetical protein